MDVSVGRLSSEELMLSNSGAGGNTWESLGQQGDQTCQSLKGNQCWIFFGRADAAAPILWPPYVTRWLSGKDSNAGKDWGPKEKGMMEDETVTWHHWINRHELEQTLWDLEGHGSLACFSRWGCKIRHNWATEQHNYLKSFHFLFWSYLKKHS